MADEQSIKVDFNAPIPDNIYIKKGEIPSIPDLSDTWNHKEFNKQPIKEQMRRLQGYFPGIENYTPMDYQNYRNKIGKPLNSELQLKEPTTLDHVINFARPAIAGAAGSLAGAGAVASEVGAPLAGAASAGAYGITDAILQKLQSSPPESLSSSMLEHFGLDNPMARTLANTGEQALLGKVGDKVLGPLFRGMGGIVNNTIGGVAGEEAFQAMNPTYSQYYKAVTGKTAPVSKWLEDTFNNSVKAKLFSAAGKEGSAQISKLAENEAGPILDNHVLSSDIANNQLQNLHKSTQFSEQQNGIVSNLAKQNTHIIPMDNSSLPTPPQYSPNETKALLGQQVDPFYRNIAMAKKTAYGKATQDALQNHIQLNSVQGPINLNSTQQFANDTLESLSTKYGSVDISKMSPQDKLIAKEATRISQQRGSMGFDDANSTMKFWEDSGYKSPPVTKNGGGFDVGKSEPVNPVQQFYRQLNSRMGSDIDESIGGWKNGSGDALKSWRQSQQAISERRAIFGGDSATNAFLDKKDTYIPTLNNAIRSPKALDDLLKSGEITLPNGTIQTTDTRGKVTGYTLNKLLSESSNSEGALNTSSFAEKWNNPDFQQVKNKLFTPGAQDAVEQILTNVGRIDEPGGSNILKNIVINKGKVVLSSSLVGGLFGGSIHGLVTGAAVGGLALGGVGLAKVLSNPTAARVLVAMSAGKIPEGMTRNSMDLILKKALNGAIVYGIDKAGKESQFAVNQDELVPK